MLHRVKELKGFKLAARDGDIGHIKDIYFDDQHWAARYLVVVAGNWLTGRSVLISPHSVKGVRSGTDAAVEVDLTREQIRHSPAMEEDQPVSRQYEEEFSRYYSFEPYWIGPEVWGQTSRPNGLRAPWSTSAARPPEPKGDRHLHSVNSIIDYQIRARDKAMGHVEDFVAGDDDWVLRYLVVDTTDWWPGGNVLFSTSWIREISWPSSAVTVDADAETIRTAPKYDSKAPIDRTYEEQLFHHYGREPYWSDHLQRSIETPLQMPKQP